MDRVLQAIRGRWNTRPSGKRFSAMENKLTTKVGFAFSSNYFLLPFKNCSAVITGISAVLKSLKFLVNKIFILFSVAVKY